MTEGQSEKCCCCRHYFPDDTFTSIEYDRFPLCSECLPKIAWIVFSALHSHNLKHTIDSVREKGEENCTPDRRAHNE